jgi:flagellar hook-basal body complex protein FliE
MKRGTIDARARGGEAHMSAGAVDRAPAGWGRLRRSQPREQHAGGHEQVSKDATASLHAELALLREENRRLSVERHMPRDAGRVADLLSAASTRAERSQAAGDEAAELLAEGMVLRESLIEVCAEIGKAMTALEARLQALVTDRADTAFDGHSHADGGLLLQLPSEAVSARREGRRAGERA